MGDCNGWRTGDIALIARERDSQTRAYRGQSLNHSTE
jgi:hypothetical protein